MSRIYQRPSRKLTRSESVRFVARMRKSFGTTRKEVDRFAAAAQCSVPTARMMLRAPETPRVRLKYVTNIAAGMGVSRSSLIRNEDYEVPDANFSLWSHEPSTMDARSKAVSLAQGVCRIAAYRHGMAADFTVMHRVDRYPHAVQVMIFTAPAGAHTLTFLETPDYLELLHETPSGEPVYRGEATFDILTKLMLIIHGDHYVTTAALHKKKQRNDAQSSTTEEPVGSI